MNGYRVYGIVDFHNSPSVGILGANRPLGSTSFLGRYALCDFALSNLTNSGIEDIGILVKDHQRSLLKHLGTMHDWVNNTKRGKMSVLYNEYGILNQQTNTDAQNLRENDWVLYDSIADYLVFQSAHIVANVDLRPIIEEHIERGDDITVVYKDVEDISKEFTSSASLEIDEDGYVVGGDISKGRKGKAHASMEIWVINRMVLADILPNHAKAHPDWSMKRILAEVEKEGVYNVHAHQYKGFALCIDSYKTYCSAMLGLLKAEEAKQLFDRNWPIYTKSHDTAPVLYGEYSDVKNSYISNGCVVEGCVEGSILSRDVKIGTGSTVKNCIIFSNVQIGDNCHIENALIDKYSVITKGKSLKGNDPEKLNYYAQGFIL